MAKAADQAVRVTPEIENKVAGDDPHSLEVLRVFFKLGVSSFGGPIAHIGYFHEEFVVRRRWLSEQASCWLNRSMQHMRFAGVSNVKVLRGRSLS